MKEFCPLNFKVFRLMRKCPDKAWTEQERKETRCTLGTYEVGSFKILCLNKPRFQQKQVR